MSLPIHVCWDSELTKTETEAVIEGINEISLVAKSQVRVFGSNSWFDGEFSSANWYVNQSRRHNGQVNAADILNLLRLEPWQSQPHIDLLATSKDLYSSDHNLNFVFGMAYPEWNVAVQSIFRFRQAGLYGDELKSNIRRVVRHEVGHLLGMANDDRRNTVESCGSHCANPICTMRQGLSVAAWQILSRMEDEAGILFCDDCLSDLGHQS